MIINSNNKINFSSLNSFEQSLVVMYGIDITKGLGELRKIEHQSVIDYLLTDVHYLVVKRFFEHDLKRSLTDEELESVMRDKVVYIGDIPKCFLKEGDIERIETDLSFLSKYNELYAYLPGSREISDILTDTNKGHSKKLMSGASVQSVKRHILLSRFGIEEHIAHENMSLDSELSSLRERKEEKRSRAKSIIDTYKRRFSA